VDRKVDEGGRRPLIAGDAIGLTEDAVDNTFRERAIAADVFLMRLHRLRLGEVQFPDWRCRSRVEATFSTKQRSRGGATCLSYTWRLRYVRPPSSVGQKLALNDNRWGFSMLIRLPVTSVVNQKSQGSQAVPGVVRVHRVHGVHGGHRGAHDAGEERPHADDGGGHRLHAQLGEGQPAEEAEEQAEPGSPD
jgi:hypothetical protein